MNVTDLDIAFTNDHVTTQNSVFWSSGEFFHNTTSAPNVDKPQAKIDVLMTVLFNIQYVLLPVFLITGIFGNTFTIMTMASKRFQNLTSRYILIFLAISDTVLLLTQPFNKLWVIDLFGGVDLRALSDVSCKVFFVIFKSAKMTSSWLVVMLCFERFVAVVFPLHAKRILQKRFIFPLIVIDYLFMFLYNGIWSFSSGIVNGKCKPDMPSIRHNVFVIVGCAIYSFIPTALLLIFTPMIITRLVKQRKIRNKLSRASSSIKPKGGSSKWGSFNKTNGKQDEMLRASIMVLGVMVAYIILIIPITTVHLYSFAAGISAFDVNNYGFFIYREIAQMLEQINYAINFFFYVMCSRTFRIRVQEFLCCCRNTGSKIIRPQEQNVISQVTSSSTASCKKQPT